MELELRELELNEFIGNVNKKDPAIKFEFTYSKTSITFLDTNVFKNQNGILCTTIYRKPNDCRNFLHYGSAHHKSLKDSTSFGQALCIKQICFETSELIKHFKDLKDSFIKKTISLVFCTIISREQYVQIEKHF